MVAFASCSGRPQPTAAWARRCAAVARSRDPAPTSPPIFTAALFSVSFREPSLALRTVRTSPFSAAAAYAEASAAGSNRMGAEGDADGTAVASMASYSQAGAGAVVISLGARPGAHSYARPDACRDGGATAPPPSARTSSPGAIFATLFRTVRPSG